jgi:hypothetical protein
MIEEVEEIDLGDWIPFPEILGGAVDDIPLLDGLGFGGADVWSFDAAGVLYMVLCMERPDKKFGTYAFRRLPNGSREWIQLQEFTEGRVCVSEEPPRGAFLTWLAPNSKSVRRAQLPGFVHPQSTGVATPVVVQTAGDSGGGIDTGAREYTTKVKKDLEAKVTKLEARLAQLEANPSFDEHRINDHIWSMITKGDAVYALLQSNSPGVVAEIQRIVDERNAL